MRISHEFSATELRSLASRNTTVLTFCKIKTSDRLGSFREACRTEFIPFLRSENSLRQARPSPTCPTSPTRPTSPPRQTTASRRASIMNRCRIAAYGQLGSFREACRVRRGHQSSMQAGPTGATPTSHRMYVVNHCEITVHDQLGSFREAAGSKQTTASRRASIINH